MLAFVMASMLVASSDPPPRPAVSPKDQPTRYCRELGSAASRSEAIWICRTRAEWLEWDSCNGATRYCPPKKKVAMTGIPGRPSAFPLNEDSRIICRKLSVTGTRLKSESVCLAKREWERMWKDSAEATLELQDQSMRVEPPK